MELKQESANSMETRQRHHLVKRLKRAVKHSQALYDICEKQSVDGRTVLDVKVKYISVLR
jgi:signal recognition particle subunit SRP68